MDKYVIKNSRDRHWPYLIINDDQELDWSGEINSGVARFTYGQAKVIIEVFKLQDCKIVKLVSKKKRIK